MSRRTHAEKTKDVRKNFKRERMAYSHGGGKRARINDRKPNQKGQTSQNKISSKPQLIIEKKGKGVQKTRPLGGGKKIEGLKAVARVLLTRRADRRRELAIIAVSKGGGGGRESLKPTA